MKRIAVVVGEMLVWSAATEPDAVVLHPGALGCILYLVAEPSALL